MPRPLLAMLRRLQLLFPFRLVLVGLAALLGFACLAAFHTSPNSAREHKGWSTLKSDPVNWVRGRRKKLVSSSSISRGDLAILPKDFQESLKSGLPLECASRLEGWLHPKYARFLRTLLDYGYHNRVRNSRTLTWKCTVYDYCGGLGDRIRGVAYALLLAMFSRRRLVIFWEHPTEGQYLHPYMMNWADEDIFQFLRTSMGSKTETFRGDYICGRLG